MNTERILIRHGLGYDEYEITKEEDGWAVRSSLSDEPIAKNLKSFGEAYKIAKQHSKEN